MRINPNEFETALKILKNYYGKLAREISTDIIQNRDSFENDDVVFKQAEDILERHSAKLYLLSTVFRTCDNLSELNFPKASNLPEKMNFAVLVAVR